ncbi:MAG: NHL repeat-containing protein [Cystobacterineae bacterium]|nr:NHL repeat-containing protein [Cystobacterineae bacterium]MCL2259445.1 NHL repeat-containing protein [Cystobacterineae bacterium]
MPAKVTVSTLAGDGTQGYVDGKGSLVKFSSDLVDIAVDSAGNLYVTDSGNHRIRKVTPGGEVSTFAGGGTQQSQLDGHGTAARFYYPSGITMDMQGNLYVADKYQHLVRKITPNREVSTLRDSNGVAIQLDYAESVAIDKEANLYVADWLKHHVRKLTFAGNAVASVSVFAGNGNESGNVDAKGTNARFKGPRDMVTDAKGNVYVADSQNFCIRKITPTGEVTTFAGGGYGYADGTGAEVRFNYPAGLTIDAKGNLYVADYFNNKIRRVTPKGVVTTIAGGQMGYVDGPGDVAQFNHPMGIAIDLEGNLYVADEGNRRIRKITLK